MAEHDLSELVVVGARVTFLIAQDNASGRPVLIGERPHCAPWYLAPGVEPSQCEAQMSLTNESDGESYKERCTREAKHRGPHVVHAEPGLPVLAWLVTPTENGDTNDE